MPNEELAPARLSLWDIEAAWLELIQARQEAEELPGAPERELAILACDEAIAEYCARETAKVDGIRAVVRGLKAAMEAAKQERDYQARRAQSAEAMIARIKGFVQSAMEASGKKRIEGRTGYLAIKGNGGLQALEITDEALLPEECCRMEGWVSADLWGLLLDLLVRSNAQRGALGGHSMRRVPDNAAIRAALAEDCPICDGSGEMLASHPSEGGLCSSCGGSGRNRIAGARLLERSSHVEIR